MKRTRTQRRRTRYEKGIKILIIMKVHARGKERGRGGYLLKTCKLNNCSRSLLLALEVAAKESLR